MDLQTYLDKQGKGAVTALFRRSGVTPTTIYDILNSGHARTVRTARLISEATDGEVSVTELVDPNNKTGAENDGSAATGNLGAGSGENGAP